MIFVGSQSALTVLANQLLSERQTALNARPHVRQKHGQEEQAVTRAHQHDAQVHPEEVHLENLRLRERQDRDPDELGDGDAGQHRAAHGSQRPAGPFDAIRL